MIFMSTNCNRLTFEFFTDSSKIIEKFIFYGFINKRKSMFCAKNNMDVVFHE